MLWWWPTTIPQHMKNKYFSSLIKFYFSTLKLFLNEFMLSSLVISSSNHLLVKGESCNLLSMKRVRKRGNLAKKCSSASRIAVRGFKQPSPSLYSFTTSLSNEPPPTTSVSTGRKQDQMPALSQSSQIDRHQSVAVLIISVFCWLKENRI